MISKISADKGVLFDFTNSQKLKESGFALQGKTVNGYVASNGDITVNVNSAKALNSVVGHEIAHVLEGTELYTALKESITEYAKTKGEYQTRYDEIAKLYEGVKGANIENELTSELVGDYLFTDSDFISKLSTENRNVFQKIYDEIKYLCKVATAGSKEARQLEKVKKAFEKAYRETTAEKNNTAEGGVIKYSLMNDVTFEKNAEDIINMTDEVALKNKEQGNFIRVMNNTPSVILENVKDAGDYEVIIRFDALYLASRKNGVLEGHYHNLGKDIITKLPQFIENPDAIVRMSNGRLNIFTTIETSKGNNGVISMEMNTVKDINSKYNKYNLVVSVFSAKDNYTKNNLTKNGVKVEYKKEDLSQVNPQLYEWLAIINDKSSKDIISNPNENVKQKQLEMIEKVNPTQGMYANTTENQNVQFSLSDNIENAEKTLYNKNSPLAIVDRAKTNNSSSLNWVYKSEIFSVNENKLFHEKISEINQGSQAFSKNSLGEYMIPIENKIVFTDGNYDSPYVREIVEVLTEYQTEFEDIRERIFNVEKGKSEKQDASRYVNLTYGKGRIVTYASGIGGVYGWEDGRRKGKTRGAVIRNYLNKQNRGRNDRTSKETQINEIVPIKETSSTDGVFSLFSKDTAPKKYGDYNVYGEDIKLQPNEDIAPVRDDVQPVKQTETLTGDIAPVREDVQKDLLSTNAKSFGITKPGDYVHVQRQVFDTLSSEGFFSDEESRSRTVTNLDSSMQVEINKKGIKETFNYDNYGKFSRRYKGMKLATVRMLPQIIENGKLMSDNVDNYHNEESTVKFAYIESEVQIDGQDVSVKIDIKKSPQKNKFWVHSVDIKEEVDGLPVNESKSLKRDYIPINSTESISNNDTNVNSDDIAPVREDVAPIKTVEDRITAKIKNYQEERSNNIRLREKSNAEFDRRIAEAQAEYDAKKNKDTKAANNILRRIETLKRRKSNIDAEIDILKKHPITIRCFLH